MSQNKLKMGNVTLRIASMFCNDYSIELYGSEIVEYTGLPQKTVSRKLNNLAEFGFLSYKRKGKNKVFSINKKFPMLTQMLVMVESFKAVEFLHKNRRLALLLNDLNNPTLIFGSYADNSYSEDSDVDIVLFNSKKDINDAPFNIHVQYSTLSDFRKKLKKGDALAIEIARKHIILSSVDEIVNILKVYYFG